MQLLWLILMCHITLRNNRLCLNISTFSLFSFFSIFLHVKSELQQRLTTSLFFPTMLRGRGCRVCAICGAEAARASEVATIQIHPSILPRELQQRGMVCGRR